MKDPATRFFRGMHRDVFNELCNTYGFRPNKKKNGGAFKAGIIPFGVYPMVVDNELCRVVIFTNGDIKKEPYK